MSDEKTYPYEPIIVGEAQPTWRRRVDTSLGTSVEVGYQPFRSDGPGFEVRLYGEVGEDGSRHKLEFAISMEALIAVGALAHNLVVEHEARQTRKDG